MIKCPQCGTKNRDDSRYCEDCGATLKFDRPAQFMRDEDDGTVVLVDHESGSVEAPVIRPSRVSLNSGSSAYSQRIPSEQRGTVGSGTAPRPTFGLSKVAFVFSILSFSMCIGLSSFFPFILGMIALKRDRNPDGSVNRLALVAVILSAIGMTVSFFWILAAMLSGNSK